MTGAYHQLRVHVSHRAAAGLAGVSRATAHRQSVLGPVDLLSDLHVLRSHSPPHVSNDNPYSEAAFKTVKYHPSFPGRFGSIQDARSFCDSFLPGTTTNITTPGSACTPGRVP